VLGECASRPAEIGLEAAILAALHERLPAALVPSALVELAALPLTPNGKLDRKALPARGERARAPAFEDAAPPKGALEERLAGVWRDLLGTPSVPRDVNFFDLGANSLLMLEASARLSSQLMREVSLVTLFRFPSVASLASHLAEDGEGAESGALASSRARGERRRDARERRAALASSVGS
jgi:hypothetical protein